MRIFTRKGRNRGPAKHPISEFWQWWSDVGRQIAPGRPGAVVDETVVELSRHVAAIHPDLAWHFGPGEAAEYRLTVSSGGVATGRPWAERWLRAAPAADRTWEYRASREADPRALSSTLSIAGHEFDLSLTRFRVVPVEEELRVHVGVHHPAFEQVGDDIRAQVSFLVLDWALGEDKVERWLGHVEPLADAHATTATATAAQLTGAVDSLARCREPDEWALAQWRDQDGLPGLASFRRGVRWIDHPTLDKHHEVAVRYPSQSNGMPVDSSALDRLREIEAALEDALGPQSLLIGHQTHAGIRTFHVYADSEDQNIDSALAGFVSRYGLTLLSWPDPSWTEVRHLTG